MPNVAVEVQRGVICVAGAESPEVREVLGLLGHVVELPDEAFDAATAVMGCAPAYLALAVEALADAGADAGLDPELARELVVETTAGTAELLRIRHPADVRERRRLAGRQHRGRPRGARRGRRPRGLRGRRAAPRWRGCSGS